MLEYKFKFIGISDNGSKIEGVKFSTNQRKLFKDLKNKGLTDIRINKVFESIEDIKFGNSKLSDNSHAYLFEELQSFIVLGNNLTDSLKFIMNSSEDKDIKIFLEDIYSDILSGSKFSTALIESGKIDQFSIIVIIVAEETGNYDQALSSLAEYYKDRGNMKGKIKSSLIKPIIMFTALLGASTYLILNVIPKIGQLFVGTSITPPFSTSALLVINKIMTNYPIFLLIGIGTIIAGIIYFFKNEKTSKYKMRLPVIGKVKKLSFQTEFLMSYYLLLHHGVQTSKAIDIIKDNNNDVLYKNLLTKISKSLDGGKQLSSILLSYPNFFDPVVGFMFRKGEQSGTSNEVAEKLFNSYKMKITKYLEHFPLILDTVTLAIGGGILIFIFSGIIFPVIKFIQNMSNLQ